MPSYDAAFSDNSYMTTIAVVLTDIFGPEWVNWDPLALSLEVREETGYETDSEFNDKAQSAAAVISTTGFHSSFEIFNNVCRASADKALLPDTYLPASVDDMTWGCTEVTLIQGTDYKEQTFNTYIRNYAGYMLDREGLYLPPRVLNFARYPANSQDVFQESVLGDESLFRMHWEDQETRRKEVEQISLKKLAELSLQLQSLVLSNGDKAFVDKLLASVSRKVAAISK